MLAQPPSSPPVATASPVLEFRGARLGMPLERWRGAPFPGATTAVRAVCSSDGADASRLGLKIAASEPSAQAVVCTYAFAGPAGPRVGVPIDDSFYAHRARYVFRKGRLSEISFTTSPNAFDAMVARIDAQMGPAKATTRDTARILDLTLPWVRMRWAGPAGVVTLVDPAADSGLMALDYVAPEPRPLATGGLPGSTARLSKTHPSG